MSVQVASGPFGLAVSDPALEQRIRAGLAETERMLRASAHSEHPLIAETAAHLLDAGGKRFRPLLTLIAAQFGDPADYADGTRLDESGRSEAVTGLDAADGTGAGADADADAADDTVQTADAASADAETAAVPAQVIAAAAVVELTHLATLYHDDVMDEAPMRRGAPSANARWDNSIAILTGDFLFARASQILADLGPEAVRLQAETFERLVTGQINECIGPREDESAIDHYLNVLADKTGSLIATSARFGALLSGAPGPVVEQLTRFGEVFGVAFQLSDDILDIASESTQSGKTPGTDLREGVMTLPTLYALASTDPESARLRELLSGPITEDHLVDEVISALRVHPALDQARDTVLRYAQEARELLKPLPDNPAKDTLLGLCDVVSSRTV